MLSYFDAHCDTIYRCLETGENSALDYGEDREEQRRYYAAAAHLRENGGHIDLLRGKEFRRCAQFFALFHDAAEAPADGMWAQCRRMHDFFLRELADNEMAGYVWDYSAYPSCGPAQEPETSEPTDAAEGGL